MSLMNLSILPLHLLALTRGHALPQLQKSESKARRPEGFARPGMVNISAAGWDET